MTSSQKKQLYPQEWMAILFLIALLLLLTLASHSCESNSFAEFKTTSHHVVSDEIEVQVMGEVKNPGKYLVKRGSLVKELLLQAKLKPTADLRRIKGDGKLKKGQCIKIPAQNMIKIVLNFADGTTHELMAPKGTKLEDLRDFYTFQSDVDMERFKKKRRLKDGEVVEVFLKN